MTSHPRAVRRTAAEQEELHAALTDLWEQRISFNQVLGLTVLSLQPHDVRLVVAMRPELVGPHAYGRLHGGVISATLDALAGLALMVALGERHCDESTEQVMHRFARMGTIDLRVDYLRQGVGSRFIAHAEVTRLGGRIGSTQMRLLSDTGTLMTTGAASYIVA